MSKGKGEAPASGRRGEIVFRIKHPTLQRCLEGSNKSLCAPGDLTKTQPDLPLSVLVSYRGMAQQWPAAGAEALGAAYLGIA